MNLDKKISCGIIGTGNWGIEMSKHIINSKKFLISSSYDISKIALENYSQIFMCKTSNSIDELVKNPNIECVFIFSPNNLHLEHATASSCAKKHVFLEKPISNSSVDGEKIIKACKENNVQLFIGHNVRYYSIFKKMKKLIDYDLLGDVIYVECNRSRPIGYEVNDKNNWRFYQETCNGGPLIQMGIHLVDTIRFLIGFEDDKIQTISVKKFLKTQNDESFSICIKMKSKIILHLFTSYMLPESFYINIFGTKGTLFADPFNGLFFQERKSFKKKKLSYQSNQPEEEEILDFYNAIIDKNHETFSSLRDSIDNLKIIEKIIDCNSTRPL